MSSSTINYIHQAMTSAIQTALPACSKLSNAYRTQDNSELLLKQGFGVRIGSGSHNRITSGSLGIRRSFDFILTRKVFATESDSLAKASAELSLINDQLSVLKAFEEDFQLGGVVLKIEYDSDGGVEFVASDQNQFLELKTTVSVLYIEAVN